MRVTIGVDNGDIYFYQKRLSSVDLLTGFDCGIEEYNKYLIEDASRHQNEHFALTWLLRERVTDGVVAYMSLISNSVRISLAERAWHSLDYPFKTFPAVKIAKLAVNKVMRERYERIGTFMIHNALLLAQISGRYSACRFLTVDADIEHNEGVVEFYKKNGFYPNEEMNNKRSKTISMRKDIWE
jgi:hypothetical protein